MSPTLKGMSDHQMDKKGQIYQTLVYDRTYQSKVLQDQTRNILQGPDTYDKMGITKNASCSHESNFKMHSDCQIEKGHIYQPLVYNRT